MPRILLTPEEREARRRGRNRHTFSDAAYQHYNPRKEGYGSAEEWIRTAEAAAGFTGTFHRVAGSDAKVDADLVLMGLQQAPTDLLDLKKAFRRSMLKAHPDHGGTNEAARNTLEAFRRLARQYA